MQANRQSAALPAFSPKPAPQEAQLWPPCWPQRAPFSPGLPIHPRSITLPLLAHALDTGPYARQRRTQDGVDGVEEAFGGVLKAQRLAAAAGGEGKGGLKGGRGQWPSPTLPPFGANQLRSRASPLILRLSAGVPLFPQFVTPRTASANALRWPSKWCASSAIFKQRSEAAARSGLGLRIILSGYGGQGAGKGIRGKYTSSRGHRISPAGGNARTCVLAADRKQRRDIRRLRGAQKIEPRCQQTRRNTPHHHAYGARPMHLTNLLCPYPAHTQHPTPLLPLNPLSRRARGAFTCGAAQGARSKRQVVGRAMRAATSTGSCSCGTATPGTRAEGVQ
jgi:hypothetical protein